MSKIKRLERLFHHEMVKAEYAKTVLHAVCRASGATVAKMKSKSRIQAVVDARYVFYYLCREKYVFTFQELGSMLDQDHATVMYGLRRVSDYLVTDKPFQQLLAQCREELVKTMETPLTHEEKAAAMLSLNSRIAHLRSWLNDHPTNPYRMKILGDLRELENELEIMDNTTTSLSKQTI